MGRRLVLGLLVFLLIDVAVVGGIYAEVRYGVVSRLLYGGGPTATTTVTTTATVDLSGVLDRVEFGNPALDSWWDSAPVVPVDSSWFEMVTARVRTADFLNYNYYIPKPKGGVMKAWSYELPCGGRLDVVAYPKSSTTIYVVIYAGVDDIDEFMWCVARNGVIGLGFGFDLYPEAYYLITEKVRNETGVEWVDLEYIDGIGPRLFPRPIGRVWTGHFTWLTVNYASVNDVSLEIHVVLDEPVFGYLYKYDFSGEPTVGHWVDFYLPYVYWNIIAYPALALSFNLAHPEFNETLARDPAKAYIVAVNYATRIVWEFTKLTPYGSDKDIQDSLQYQIRYPENIQVMEATCGDYAAASANLLASLGIPSIVALMFGHAYSFVPLPSSIVPEPDKYANMIKTYPYRETIVYRGARILPYYPFWADFDEDGTPDHVILLYDTAYGAKPGEEANYYYNETYIGALLSPHTTFIGTPDFGEVISYAGKVLDAIQKDPYIDEYLSLLPPVLRMPWEGVWSFSPGYLEKGKGSGARLFYGDIWNDPSRTMTYEDPRYPRSSWFVEYNSATVVFENGTSRFLYVSLLDYWNISDLLDVILNYSTIVKYVNLHDDTIYGVVPGLVFNATINGTKAIITVKLEPYHTRIDRAERIDRNGKTWVLLEFWGLDSLAEKVVKWPLVLASATETIDLHLKTYKYVGAWPKPTTVKPPTGATTAKIEWKPGIPWWLNQTLRLTAEEARLFVYHPVNVTELVYELWELRGVTPETASQDS